MLCHLPRRCSKMFDMKARNRRRDAKLKARMRWSFEFEKVWNFVLLWYFRYWFVNSGNFVVYLKCFTNIRQKTRDYLLYTRFWVGRIAGWEGDGAPGAGAHKCLPPNLPANQSSSGKRSVGNSLFYGSFGVTCFLECKAVKPVMCQQLTEARDIEQQLQSTGS